MLVVVSDQGLVIDMSQSSSTYLAACLRDGRLVRWPSSSMPIKVYVAPFTWHEKSKQQESYQYQYMIMEAFDAWAKLSGGRVSFQMMPELRNSQIDIKWRRVDRRTLGHCEYMYNDQWQLYSAEIQVGLTDGLVHPEYNSKEEVQHTIYHEICHALGVVGHSDQPNDIMYVPHQYGVKAPSDRDVQTLQTLYDLPVGFDYQAAARQLKLRPPVTLDRVVAAWLGKSDDAAKEPFPPIRPKAPPSQPEVLNRHHQILSQIGQFHLATQKVVVRPDVRKLFIEQKIANPQESPPSTLSPQPPSDNAG